MNYFINLSTILFLLTISNVCAAKEEILLDPFHITKQSATEVSLGIKDQYSLFGSIGTRTPLTSVINLDYNVDLQLALDTNASINLFRTKELSFKLRTANFFLSAPLTLRNDDLYYSLIYSHRSDHLGDGAKNPTNAIIFSREFISFYATKKLKLPNITSRFYVGVNRIMRSFPSSLDDTSTIEIGTENSIDDFLFVWYNAELSVGLNQTFRAGIAPTDNIGLFWEVYLGKNKSGQFYNKDQVMQMIGIFVK